MTQTTTGYVDLGDGKLYYEAAGEGTPFVLSHAGFVDSRMWDDQWHDFVRHHRVIRFDMRGYGKSDPVTAPIARRDDLYHLLKQLEITRAFLLGCSLSGEAMLDFALEHPEMTLGLIVVSGTPSGFELQGEPPRHLLEMMGAMQQGDLALASELQLRIWIDGPFREPDQVDPRVRQRSAEMTRTPLANGTFAKADANPHRPLDPPAAQRLTEIHAPTLIMAGGLDHPEILRAAEVMRAAIPGAQKVVIADCAHLPNMEKPAEFNRAVLGFLRSLS